MSDHWRSVGEVIEEGAQRRYEKLTDAQRDVARSVIEIAHEFQDGAITLDEAMYRTVGGYIRFQVYSVTRRDSADGKALWHLIDAISQRQSGIVETKFGTFASQDLVGDGKRYITKVDPATGEVREMWEQQYVEDGVSYWPSERPPQPTSPRRRSAAVAKQVEAWGNPEDTDIS